MEARSNIGCFIVFNSSLNIHLEFKEPICTENVWRKKS